MHEVILSVGIDIGTSTTQLVFSRLTIENRAGSYTVPRIDIVNKEVVYRSKIHFTPLRSSTEIDAEAVKEIVREEYRAAGRKPEDVRTGAVIITGETARKQNANEVLEALSDLAGEFVVATAGPDLESILAARGAGADSLSAERRTVVANLDVGGGTSNIALYQSGVLRGTCCLDIGGRLIKVENGTVTYVFPKIRRLAEAHGIALAAGDRADGDTLYRVCRLMAGQLAQAQAAAQGAERKGRDVFRRRGRLHLPFPGGGPVPIRGCRGSAGQGHTGGPGFSKGGAVPGGRDDPGDRGGSGNPHHPGQREHDPL